MNESTHEACVSEKTHITYKTYLLPPRVWVPNNRKLPAVVYRHALPHANGDLTRCFEVLFERNHWMPRGRRVIFDDHQFHSSAHEVLGIASGVAEVILGGPGASIVELEAGDAMLLPAGTGYCLHAYAGCLHVVGACPAGQQWDVRRDAPTADELAAMESLPFPASDPVLGDHGPVVELWMKAA
jgi:uncharacterized protein YjlB